MNKNIKKYVEDLAFSGDKIRLDALQTLLKMTDSKVDWVYEVWDHLLEKLENENSYQRSISILLLCNLAKSDTEDRLALVLDSVLTHTKEEKFITSRQCIQNIWKAAATNKPNLEIVLKHLEKRFVECGSEKHYNLLRQDMIQSMLLLYEQVKDDDILTRARMLIAGEPDLKYRKKYEALLYSK